MDKKAQWSLVGAAWVLALGALGLGWLVLQRIPALHSAAPAGGQAQELAPGPAPAGSKFTDPVSKGDVIVAADTPHVIYQGRNYYFSAAQDDHGRDDKTLFLMDPELYLSGVSALRSPVPDAAPQALSPAAKAP